MAREPIEECYSCKTPLYKGDYYCHIVLAEMNEDLTMDKYDSEGIYCLSCYKSLAIVNPMKKDTKT